MLSPDQIQDAGDAIAAIYADMEAGMLDHLAGALLNVESLGQRSITELNLLAQSQAHALKAIIDENRDAIAAEVLGTCEEYLKASDADDMRRLGKGEAIYPRQVAATVAGMQKVLDRDNLDMVEGAKQAFLRCSTEAVTKVNSGLFTTERALHQAVRKLERDGVSVISYRNAKTGVQTVQNKVDVAVRRHIRTQIAQDGARMTMQRIEAGEVSLVEVSSHAGARPEHAEWQGRVYSLKGDVTIEGTRYRDFYAATGYGNVDGLLGANCRHSFGPYIHGMKRYYEPTPSHPSGLPNSEVYDLTQRQRYLERKIREDKRELRGERLIYEADPSLANKANVLRAEEKLRKRQEAMRDFIRTTNARSKAPGVDILQRSPRREWAGDMPKGVKVKASHRRVDEFLDQKGMKAQMRAAGVSKSRMKAEIAAEMARRDATLADFASLAKSEQQDIKAAILHRKTALPVEERRKNFKPVNPAFLAARRKEIEKAGGMVWQDSESIRYLNNRGADAATLGDIIALREDATISEVLEEEFHFHQNKRGDYAELDVKEMHIRREIDAQQYLLDVAKRYKIPRIETEQTKAALRDYLNKLKEITGENH